MLYPRRRLTTVAVPEALARWLAGSLQDVAGTMPRVFRSGNGRRRDHPCLYNREVLKYRDSVCAGRLRHGVGVGITGIPNQVQAVGRGSWHGDEYA